MRRALCALMALVLISLLLGQIYKTPAQRPWAGIDNAAVVNPRLGSGNWSGYAFQGGPFHSVSGTFVVPPGRPDGTCDDYMSAWVGVDGVSDQDLIQAGIAEGEANPATGNCTPGHLYINAWWEILPAPETPISMPVHVGDVVSVDIEDLGQGQWDVSIFDQTSMHFFTQDFRYAGPASSAEWVVEAPEVGGFIADVMAYGHTQFSGLHLDGRAALLDDIWLVPGNSDPTSVPETVPNARALMRDGFSVVYTGP